MQQMIHSKLGSLAVCAVFFIILLAANAEAQAIEQRVSVDGVTELPARPYRARAAAPDLRSTVFSLNNRDAARLGERPAPAPQTGTGNKRSVRRKVLGAIVGATAGLFAGGYLGAIIEGDRCDCDDPGLVGALIGAPVGTVAGGILGYKFLF
jgi:hypothetical protein